MGTITALTTVEAAAVLEVSPVTVRSYVQRGQLQPVERGVKPLLFDEDTVLEFKHARTPAVELDRVRQLAERWADS